MKPILNRFPSYLFPCLCACFLLSAAQVRAAQIEWTGASGLNLFWSTPGNWLPAGPPASADDVILADAGAAADATTVNNIVDAGITIQSLWIGPTNLFQNTQIDPGVILDVSGSDEGTQTLFIGTKEYVDLATTVTSTFRGSGTLNVSNSANVMHVRQSFGSSGAHLATLDMSALDNFAADLENIYVGVGDGTYRRAMGELFLAKTNQITVRGTYANPGLLVGDNSGNNNGNSSESDLWLGQATTIQADYVRIGAQKQRGFMAFNPAFTSPTLIMRGSAGGTNRVTEFGIGDESEQGSSGNPSRGTVDLLSGSVDILADTLLVGKGQTGTGREAEGFLSVGAGTLDINTFDIAYQSSASTVNRVDGTVNLVGTTTTVNDLLRLGRFNGADAARNATLNIAGGSLTVGNTLACEGTVTLRVTNATVNLPPASEIFAHTLVVENGTVNNARLLSVTNSLVIGNGSSITGTEILDMGTDPFCNWDFTFLPGGFTVATLLQGSGLLSGDVTLVPGASLKPGRDGLAGTLTFYNNLTLNDSKLTFDLSSSGFGINDQVSSFSTLSLQGVNEITLRSLEGSLDTTYTLFNYSTLNGTTANLSVGGPLAQSRYTFTFDTSLMGSIRLLVGGSGAANLTWVGDGSANLWDLQGAANWNNGIGADKFYNLDNVTFDDTGSATPNVTLSGLLIPGSISFNNNSKHYALGGSGRIGGGTLTLGGAGGLTLQNTGTNTFPGGATVNAGALTLAGDSANDFGAVGLTINPGASTTVANTGVNSFGPTLNLNGTLTFEQNVDASLAANVTGVGELIKKGSGVLTVEGDNSALFGVPFQILSGTIRATAANSLPSLLGVIITNTGSLDVNGANLDTLPVTVSGNGHNGQGAIVNNSGNPAFLGPNLRFVTMAAHTTFGGTGRWDLRSPGGSTGDPSTANLSTGGQPFNLTKVGPNGVYIVSATVDPVLADIIVQEGTLAFEGNTTSMGDPAKTLTIETGATLQFYRTTNLWNKQIVLNGSGTNNTVFNASWTNTLIAPITLHGECLMNAGGDLLIFNGPLGGDGSLIKVGGSTLVLGTANNYTGPTLVSNGTLMVTGQIQSSSAVTVDGGTLAGSGTIAAPVSVNPDGTLAPGENTLGTLNLTGILTLAGTCEVDANKTGASFTSDLIQGVTTLTYGGTLQLNLTGDALVVGDQFKLFDAATYAGAFAAVAPAPGAGLAWDASSLTTDGTLKVIVAPPASPTIATFVLSGSNLEITGTGGTPGATYHVLGSTDVAVPLNLWLPVLTNTFDAGGNFSATLPVDPGIPQRFFTLELP